VPGQETQVKDRRSGPAGYYVVYVPPDYTPKRLWPAIFCYHGKGGRPTTFPYRESTEGKDFVIIGMDYFWNSMDTSSKIDRDVATVRQMAPDLVKRLNLDPEQLFIAGNSAGGFLASGIAEATPSLWAGLIVLGAGRYYHLHHRPVLPRIGPTPSWPSPGAGVAPSKGVAGFATKPVYIGVGERDTNHQFAEWAAKSYREMGARVTVETYRGAGHGIYPKSTVLKEWLQSNGPLKQANASALKGRTAESAGQLGEAYQKYLRASSLAGAPQISAEAARAVERLTKAAQAQLAAADDAVAGKRYDDAVGILSRLAASYRGSEFGNRAGSRLKAIRSDPDIQDEAKQAKQNARALALEKKARQAEEAKDYLTAMTLYARYVAAFKDADRYPIVKAHFESLKADPKVQAAYRKQKAERDCRNWLDLADNLLKAGKTEKAKAYLQKILDTYGNTEWADQAKERLAKLKAP